ncbi:DUF1801 domain-containing protein [Sediminibacterium sp. TEGAF015]|uniref:DUF1801 domain-containing protein n=1 Tax=Sediminibacterium sp. TEGAF015 TaxID=575378 RepID=UPI0021FF0927|nr:DUF1801 domain-containing protein [Sediminibacterium sp. TEGAF015]BDQ11403.1 hypothetical protein TEGAF0_06200 [Sediminibacterium sp. TEGAF015]
MSKDIVQYNKAQTIEDSAICDLLANAIDAVLKESDSKIWHAHPVWFINDNPIVGYSKQKKGIRLMFWSGSSFDEEELSVKGGKFKDASVFYQNSHEINMTLLNRWLKKSREIQWDYKNIIKRKGKLEKI